MPRIQVTCLDQRKEITGAFGSIDDVKSAIKIKFQNQLGVNQNNEKSINFILTYFEEVPIGSEPCRYSLNADSACNNVHTINSRMIPVEKELKSLETILNHKEKWFDIYVKRVWRQCCACLSVFNITCERKPFECPNAECSYQYCFNCVKRIKRITPKNKEIYCMHCTKPSPSGPKENPFILNLLWQDYAIKYDADSFFESDSMDVGKLANFIEFRAVHLECLAKSLEDNIDQTTTIPESIESEMKRVRELIERLKIEAKVDSDIECARILLQRLKVRAVSIPELERAYRLIGQLKKLKEQVKELWDTDMDDDEEEKQIKLYAKDSEALLSGTDRNAKLCEYFISICEQLIYYNEQAVFAKYFPLLHAQIDEWEELMSVQNDFQPKIIDAFHALEKDLKQRSLSDIPCKIGVIGYKSAGKSSLINRLRKNDNGDANKVIYSPVSQHKSTFCRLEFQHVFSNEKSVNFVDIEGSTDRNVQSTSVTDYYYEIIKADCDLYIIVFDNDFTDLEYKWKIFIEKQLHRQCWLVRTKIDETFQKRYKENSIDYTSTSTHPNNRRTKNMLQQIRSEIVNQIKSANSACVNTSEIPSKLYLICTNDDKFLSEVPNAKVDLEELRTNIENLPLGIRAQRLQRMATYSMAEVINNCFRRGYVVTVMKHKVAAGVAAAVPFLDLFARYCSRETIRQEFGVNDHAYLVSKIQTKKSNEFQEYLKKKGITVDGLAFKTSAFNRAVKKESSPHSSNMNNTSSAVAKVAGGIGVAGVSVSDDVLRFTGILGVNTLRSVSIAFIVGGAVLSVGMCAWAAESNGRQMYDYLNRLCDDLICVSNHVAGNIISLKNNTNTDTSEISDKSN